MQIYVVTETEYPMYEGDGTYFYVRKAFKDEQKAYLYAKPFGYDVTEIELE